MVQKVAHKDLHRVVMTCLIYNDKGRYFIMKRSPNLKVYPGKWTIPGGGLETDDYINEPQTSPDTWDRVVSYALRREVMEESGIVVGELEYHGSAAFIRPDGIPVVILRFAGPYKSGEVKLDPEDSTEYAWVTAKEAESYDLLGNIPAEIKMMDKELKSK